MYWYSIYFIMGSENLVSKLKDETWIVPIYNLNIDETIKLGDVELFPCKSDEIKKLIKNSRCYLDSGYKKDESLKKFERNQIEDLICCAKEELERYKMDHINDLTTFGKIELELEHEKGRSEARIKIDERLNFLRLFYYSGINLKPPEEREYFGIKGFVLSRFNNHIKSIENYNDNNIFSVWEMQRRGSRTGPPWIDDKGKSMIECYKEKIEPIWEKEKNRKTNKFENSLLNSIHWFGKAMKYGVEDKDRFVYLTTSLEALLNFDNVNGKTEKFKGKFGEEYNITNSLRYGIALLTENKGNREECMNRVKDLYNIRSGIIHGEVQTPSNQDMSDLHRYSQNVILKLIKTKDPLLKTKNGLLNYLINLKNK
jgi:hypothetical protein